MLLKVDDRFEVVDETKIDGRAMWRTFRRRLWWFLLPAFVVWAAVWTASWFLPSMYRSETVILVEQQRVPEQYVLPNVRNDLQQRLQSMTQQVLSRTRLMRIMEQFNLYSNSKHNTSTDDLIERMRKDIQIDLVQRPGGGDLSAFKIAYLSHDPQLAQQVASQLSSLFIDENLRIRQEQSEDTTAFLDSQLEQARESLTIQEAKVRDFKSKFLGELPGQVQGNVQILSGLQARVQQEMDALGQARQQNVYLESLLNQYQASGLGVNATSRPAKTSTDDEVTRLRAQLASLSAMYTDDHPDVRKTRSQLKKAEAEQKQKADTDQGDPSTAAVDPQTMPRLQLESQLKANRAEIENRRAAIRQIEAQIGGYQARLNTSPLREQQLADLTRDYDQSRKNYEDLLAKRDQSKMATNLEKRQQGEQFRVLDPANLPQKPYSPNRLKLAILGLGAGFFCGIVVIVGTEVMDDRIHSRESLQEIVQAPVLVDIPHLRTQWEQRRQEALAYARMAGATVLMLLAIAGLGISYLFG